MAFVVERLRPAQTCFSGEIAEQFTLSRNIVAEHVLRGLLGYDPLEENEMLGRQSKKE